MLMALALLMPETVRVLEVATELSAAPVWAVKLKAVGTVSIGTARVVTSNAPLMPPMVRVAVVVVL